MDSENLCQDLDLLDRGALLASLELADIGSTRDGREAFLCYSPLLAQLSKAFSKRLVGLHVDTPLLGASN